MAECDSNSDCLKINEFMKCRDGMCICNDGYTFIENSWVLRGCYEKSGLFASCVTTEQCIAMNRNTYCNPSNQCTCSAGYYFDGRECVIRYEGNLKAQEVYKAAVVAAACFIVAVVGIFVACIVRRSFCRREQPAQTNDSTANSDIFSISDEIAALRAVDKPPSYEEVLQIERTFYGIPPPEYSLVRNNSALHNQAIVGVIESEMQNSEQQETPADIHAVNLATEDTLCTCIGNTALTPPSMKNCCFSRVTESPTEPGCSVLLNACEPTRDFKNICASTMLNCGVIDIAGISTSAEGFLLNPSSPSLQYNEFPISDGLFNMSPAPGVSEAYSQAFSYTPSTPPPHTAHSCDSSHTHTSKSLPASPLIPSHPFPHQKSLHLSCRRQLVLKSLLSTPFVSPTSLIPECTKSNLDQCTINSSRNDVKINSEKDGDFDDDILIHEGCSENLVTTAYDNPAYVAEMSKSP